MRDEFVYLTSKMDQAEAHLIESVRGLSEKQHIEFDEAICMSLDIYKKHCPSIGKVLAFGWARINLLIAARIRDEKA